MAQALSGKVAIITGGNGGIGMAIARRFQELGAIPVLVGRSKNSLDAAAAELGGDVRTAVSDVTDDDSVRALFEREQQVDIIVTLAGGAMFGPIDKLDLADVRELFAARVFGQMSVAHFAVPRMKEGGVIIFVSGVGDVVGLVPYTAGSAVDGAINALTRSLAVELGERGIRVNAISPGVIRSGIKPGRGEEFVKNFVDRAMEAIPLVRQGEPDDVARAAVYLATAPYTNGQIIQIDGGWSAV